MDGKLAITLATMAFLLLSPLPATANEGLTYESLKAACSAVVTIYEAREKERLLAGITTTRNDAIQAGYCKGVIEAYQRQGLVRCKVDWYRQAIRIAQSREHGVSVDEVLRRSCEI